VASQLVASGTVLSSVLFSTFNRLQASHNLSSTYSQHLEVRISYFAVISLEEHDGINFLQLSSQISIAQCNPEFWGVHIAVAVHRPLGTASSSVWVLGKSDDITRGRQRWVQHLQVYKALVTRHWLAERPGY
jgi:hypothetical protein